MSSVLKGFYVLISYPFFSWYKTCRIKKTITKIQIQGRNSAVSVNEHPHTLHPYNDLEQDPYNDLEHILVVKLRGNAKALKFVKSFDNLVNRSQDATYMLKWFTSSLIGNL